MWPSDTGGSCVPLWRKRKYPCVQSSVTMDNLCVAPSVWAMPGCFPVQYKFLYYDEPCFLKEGTVPSVREPGQGWGWMDRQAEESLICSLLYHGEAMAKHIKASFRSPDWSVPFFFFFFVDDRLCGQSGNIKYAEAKARRHSPTLGEGKEGLNGQEGGGFLAETWKSVCAGGHTSFWGLTVFSMYLQGMYEYLINESQAQGKCNKRVVALQGMPITQTHTPCPPV